MTSGEVEVDASARDETTRRLIETPRPLAVAFKTNMICYCDAFAKRRCLLLNLIAVRDGRYMVLKTFRVHSNVAVGQRHVIAWLLLALSS